MGGQKGGGGNRGGMRGMMYNQQGFGGNGGQQGYGNGMPGGFGGPNHLTSLMGQSQQMGFGGGYPGQQQQQRDMGFNNYTQQHNFPTANLQSMAKQLGGNSYVPNTGNSFVQGSLNSKKGDSNYDAFSDFNNDGMVTTLDFSEYNKANPAGSMVESQGSRDSKMDQMRSMQEAMGKMQSSMGGGYGGQQGYGGYGGYGGGYGQRYYKDGGLIRGYQDGGAMGGEIVSEPMAMSPDPMSPGPGMGMGQGGGDEAMLAIVMEAKSALEGTHPDPMSAIQTFVEVFGEEELMSLKEHVVQSIETGEDRFASDGMSDSIPGNIDGMEDVALSEGEYVVPADVVSGMGNGDTDSGAQRMREMVEMVRSARTGMSEQPPAIDPSMYSPV